MPRFLISARRTGQISKAKLQSLMDDVEGAFSSLASASYHVGSSSPTSRWTIHLDADADEVQALVGELSDDVIVEPELLRFPAVASPLPLAVSHLMASSSLTSAGIGQGFDVTVRGGGEGLEAVQLTLTVSSFANPSQTARVTGRTDIDGKAKLPLDTTSWFPTALIVEPREGFWGWLVEAPSDGAVIDLPPLPKSGPIGWWVTSQAPIQYSEQRGESITIGIVDSGIGPHPYLDHVEVLGSIINGTFDESEGAGNDAARHGTHVCGLVAARPVTGSGDYAGVAPGATVKGIRVFGPTGGANQGDIADAIEVLAVDHDCDIINLSLGGSQGSAIERDAILMAAEHGALCIAAAGNGFSAPIDYPATYPEVAAVSALGVYGTSPDGSLASRTLPTDGNRYSGWIYLADFSNVGYGMACSGAGVGLISTVPAGGLVAAPYAAMSGTSMSSPVVCGLLATLLARDPVYLNAPRTLQRAQRAASVLLNSAASLGLDRSYQGFGLVLGAGS